MADYVNIFDTTLRDGEQSPGASMTHNEKLALGELLETMGVHIIEAGFPAASVGDFEAVSEIARPFPDCSSSGATIQISSVSSRAICSNTSRPGALIPSSLVSRIFMLMSL